MKTTPLTSRAYRLLHEAAIALAHTEANGIRVDEGYLDSKLKEYKTRIADSEDSLRAAKFYRRWKRRFGDKTNMDSRQQLGHLLYDVMKVPVPSYTETGKPSTDESAFERVTGVPFVKEWVATQKMKKLRNTYLKGIKREVVNGFVHPNFNTHIARSYRLSSSDPNFQNFPVRNKVMGEAIRSCFIPREEGWSIGEGDYSGQEVKVAYCYHLDPNMGKYLTDPTTDMHRDTAADVYMLTPEQVSKDARYCAKNRFVFPQFYGSYYVDCARAMWDSIEMMNLRVMAPGDVKEATGPSIKEHLAKKGIKALGECDPSKTPVRGTFEHHVREVEKHFWNERFSGYASWKKKWVARYHDRGYFDSKLGFRYSGICRRNEVLNWMVQGDASHCLVESLIEIHRRIRKARMQTKLCGPIHDSLVFDAPPDELADYCGMAKEVMTKVVPEKWQWIVIPLDVEFEVAPPDAPWFKKEKYKV